MLEPVKISLDALNLATLMPMLMAVAGGLVILTIDLIKENLHKSLYVMLSVLIILIDLGGIIGLNVNDRGFFDLMLVDGISIVTQIIILIASIIFIPLALTSKRFHEYSYPEFFALFLFMVAGLQFMVSSDNLILIFIGLETSSLALYTLIALHNRHHSFEAAVKYFTMGALAAGLFTMGSAILYAISGSLELGQIADVLQSRMGDIGIMALMIAGASFLLGAFAFKLSLFPFHTWAPDVYEGASAPLAGFMSVAPKIAAFVVAMRIFEMFIKLDVEWVQISILSMAVVTMTLANIMALVQQDVKRMLAYSSISHAGFVMAAIALATTKANSAVFLYYGLFMFTNLGAFTMLWVSRHKNKIHHARFDHPYEKFAGMINIMPLGAVIMALFMLSLAGVPPFSVFWGKIYIMSAAVDVGMVWLAIVMGINSAISAYYYLKLVVYMFLKEPVAVTDETTVYYNLSKPLMTVLGITAFVTVASIFFVQPLLEYITHMVKISGY
ncbi:MAG TPA: NADH-quinone oxidoreductase subunit NuoN [Campylobacterales bacterium]|nr:NADH-quinone oxidoreductase subunit NuoN [Campylobacterales bacterium]